MALRSMVALSEPHTFELADQRMATVMTEGESPAVAQQAVEALYASINELRRSRPFDLEPLRVRWAVDEHGGVTHWSAMWGLPVPTGVESVPQVDTEHAVRVEVWAYGTIAEVMHEGSRAEKSRAIDKLRDYVKSEGLRIIGPYEEEYLSGPSAAVPKTLIRYRVSV